MRFQLLIIINFFMLCHSTTSKHDEISWNEKRKLWQVEFHINGKKQKSYFQNEFDAAKKLNKLCETMENPSQNPMLNQQKNEKTSQYKGVSWNKQIGKWHALLHPKGQKQTYGGHFNDELDAAKKVNQLCEELGISPLNPTINAIPNQQYQKKEETSQYKGVTWHKQRKTWYVLMYLKGAKLKFGGTFKDELDAAKKVNQLCEELTIPLKNPEISAMPNQQYRYQKSGTTSLYKGVSWHREIKKWRVQLSLKGKKTKDGGYYNNELDAGKRVNQICEELGIPLQNPTISAIPNEKYQVHKKNKTSQYKGVNWHRGTRKWCVRLSMKGGKSKYGGIFNDELNAAKKVNQLCQKLGIPPQNSAISAIPSEEYQKKENKSKFKGVYWHRENRKWYVLLYLKRQKQKYGGVFTDELSAAQRVNQLCEELGIPPQNPTISAIPNEQYQEKEKTSQYKGVGWYREGKKWRVQLSLKGEKPKNGGYFHAELDAAKKGNQLCEELGTPPQNPKISTISNEQYQHDDYQNIENPVISCAIVKTDNDHAKKKKRKREKEVNDDDKLYYFYENLLN